MYILVFITSQTYNNMLVSEFNECMSIIQKYAGGERELKVGRETERESDREGE